MPTNSVLIEDYENEEEEDEDNGEDSYVEDADEEVEHVMLIESYDA